tara:strand:+ start:740 stop:1174 length:435 start_codon:yes stop_codon:yes gene_type:complete
MTYTATDYTSKGNVSTRNAELGLEEAKNLRGSLNKITEYFDRRLIGDLTNVSFNFDPYEYDVVYSGLSNIGVSKVSAEIMAYEIMALSKWYDVSYDEILPVVEQGKLTLTKKQLNRLNTTRPRSNQLNVVNAVIDASITNELVD